MNSGMEQLEDDLTRLVGEALDAVAEEFAVHLDQAAEVVAARFSVAGIASMWSRQVGAVRERLAGAVAEAAEAFAAEQGLPALDTSAAAASWRDRLDQRLAVIGQRLAERAREVLAEAVDAGHSLTRIKERLLDVFRSGDGAQLGESRARQIASSEAHGAWEAGRHAAAEAAHADGVSMVKVWVARSDDRVRSTHRHAHHQRRPVGEPFDIGGHKMMHPGDQTAPVDLWINCRCSMQYERATTAALGGAPMDSSSIALTFEGVPEGAEGSLRQLVEAAAGAYGATVTFGPASSAPVPISVPLPAEEGEEREKTRRWSTPGSAALAFEGQQTGDGRIFAAGALMWDETRSLPLQYADEMLSGHEGAELVGAIETMARDGNRITGEGVLYVSREAGADVAALLEEDAPLGVSVDLDDVDVEFVIRPQEGAETKEPVVASATIDAMSVTGLADGAWHLQVSEGAPITAAGGALIRSEQRMQITTDTYGRLPADALHAATERAGISLEYAIVAAAGDGDDAMGRVVDQMKAGDALMRITRARARGATLVAVPAFADARIVLTDEPAIAVRPAEVSAASESMGRVVDYVSSSPVPVGARQVAAHLGLDMAQARALLAHAARTGMLARLSPGRYRGVSAIPEGESIVASVVGDPDLPVATTAKWNADAAAKRVLAYAKGNKSGADGERERRDDRGNDQDGKGKGPVPPWLRGKTKGSRNGQQAAGVGSSNKLPWMKTKQRADEDVDVEVLAQAFLWRQDDGDPTSLKSYKIGVADVIDGRLQIVPEAVLAAAQLVNTTSLRIPEEDAADLRARVDALYDTLSEEMGRDLTPPWKEDADQGDPRDPRRHVNDGKGDQGQGRGRGNGGTGRGGDSGGRGLTASAGGDFADIVASIAEAEPEPENDVLTASVWSAMRDVDPMPAVWFKEPTEEELPDGVGGVQYKDGRVFGWVARKGEPHAGYPGKRLTIESLGRIDTSHFLRAKFPLDDGTTVRAGAMTMNAGHHRDGAECETAACQFDDTRTVAAIVTVGMSKRGMWFSGAASPWLAASDMSVFRACQPSYHMVKRGASYQLRAVLSVPVPGHSTPLTASVIERSNLAIAAAADLAGQDDEGPVPTDFDSLEVLTQALTSDTVLNRLADALSERFAVRETRHETARAEIEALAAQVNQAA